MIDTMQPMSPGWWLARLADKLARRRPDYQTLADYFDGSAFAPSISSRAVRDAYRRLQAMARTNFAELVVEATRERMVPVAFRTGADSDEGGDSEAWRIWQANALDADSALVHRASLSMGDAYVIVGGVDPELEAPLITVEDPREVVVEVDPARKRRVVAAAKFWWDDVMGRDRGILFLPGFVMRAMSGDRQSSGVFDASSWTWERAPEALPAPVVPVVAFPNRADTYGRSSGEYEAHLAILDRINYQVLNRLEIATMQAFRQRAVKGVPDRDADGNLIDYSDVFAADPGAMWLMPETAELWESGVVDLSPIRQAIRDDVQDLAAVTRTPLYYLTPDAANGSAEGASLAREGLVHKALDRMVQAGEAWEQVMSLAFTFAGDERRARRRDMEVVWASPERNSLAERFDAAAKAVAAGVPWRHIMSTVLQFSPQEVDRMAAERASDAFLTGAAGGPDPAAQAAALKAQADALGVLIRSGVDPADAAGRAGLTGLAFTGAVPVSLRLPEVDAQDLESGG